MRNSPFAIFRRNQRQLMVVLTGLAMFAFIFLDDSVMRGGQLPRALGVIFVALVCAGGLWVVGAPRGKGNEWALYGALLGAVAAFFGLRAQTTNNVVVATKVGTFTRSDFQDIAQRRAAANRFVFAAASTIEQATKERLPVEGFGDVNESSLLQRAILLKEAKSRGISVSDEGVLDFIKDFTNDKLALPDYQKILRDLNLAEADLFNILREELSAQLALQMELPPALQSGMGSVETPLTYWKQFQMLNVRESLEVAAVPVSAFMTVIPDNPKDSELSDLFTKFKNQLPTNDGQPGFLQDRQVTLAYVAADFETFEKGTEPNDEEVKDYYETNKDAFYRVQEIPDSPSGTPFDDQPASALDPANVAPASSAIPADNTPPAPAKPEEGAAARPVRDLPVQLVSFQTESKTAANRPDEKPKTEASKDDAPKPDAPKSEPVTTPESQLPPSLTVPSLTAAPSPEGKLDEKPKYKELDENLKSEIKDRIMRTRAFEAMGIASDKALVEMNKLADRYLSEVDPERQKLVAQEITEALKKYAEANRLEYKETAPMTQNELFSSTSETIGAAQESSANPFQPGNPVATVAFDGDTLYYPKRADSPRRDKRYAYWKLADVPAHAPEFNAVREQVAEAWKREQARPRAEKRAQELADLIKNSGQPPSEALSGQTITGTTDSDAVAVRETPRFSWLNMPRNMPFQFNPMFTPPPELSRIEGVEEAGPAFMQKVFEEMAPGDVSVVPNHSRSVYYVVRVKQRDATPTQGEENLGLTVLQQQFLSTGRAGFAQGPYMYLNRDRLVALFNDWRKAYEGSYDVQWNRTEEDARPPE